MITAIILAGGVGSRVGYSIPKQFVMIQGKPVIAYTISTYQEMEEIDSIEVVCIHDYIGYMRQIVEENSLTKVKWIIPGGDTYHESLIKGIYNLREHLSDDDIVIIQDSAAPFTSEDVIRDSIRVCREKGNANSGTPTYIVLGSNDGDGTSSRSLDRSSVIQLACPHTFPYGYIYDLYKRAEREGLLEKAGYTTELMGLVGDTVYISKGCQTNLKITTKEDLELFEGYVLFKKMKKRKAALKQLDGTVWGDE